MSFTSSDDIMTGRLHQHWSCSRFLPTTDPDPDQCRPAGRPSGHTSTTRLGRSVMTSHSYCGNWLHHFLFASPARVSAAEIKARVAALDRLQHQGAVGRAPHSVRPKSGPKPPVPAGAGGQDQLRRPSGKLPVPAEGPAGGLQQGAVQADVLPDSHHHSVTTLTHSFTGRKST